MISFMSDPFADGTFWFGSMITIFHYMIIMAVVCAVDVFSIQISF